MKVNKIVLAFGVAGLVNLTGCSDSDSAGATTTPTPSPAPATTTYSVKAIDGYLRNAKVWLDVDGDFIHDEDEPSAMSGDGGVASLDVTEFSNYESFQLVVQAIQGETIDEDHPNQPVSTNFVMSAPAGEVEITPLSSLVNILMHKHPDILAAGDQQSIAELKQASCRSVADMLGIDEEAVLSDFNDPANSNPKAAYAAQAIVQSERILPKEPQQLAEIIKDVESETSNAESTVPELKLVAVVTEKIKSTIKEIEQQLKDDGTNDEDLSAALDQKLATAIAETDFPIAPPSDGGIADTDGDGVTDDLDAFSEDANEWVDSDGDGTGNNGDLNDDSVEDPDNLGNYLDDNYPDAIDVFPTDASRAGDHDGDGVDSIEDAFPQNSQEWLDTDSDTIGNNADTDDDNDGFADVEDRFPLDATQAGDHDNDGVDSLIDSDDDGDGTLDDEDTFPLDSSESIDTDSDGIGNNADTDDDNDGYEDNNDSQPLNDQIAGDHDGDGQDSVNDPYPFDFDNDDQPDATDLDDDNDGFVDTEDQYPKDALQAGDHDSDGVDSVVDVYPYDFDNDGYDDDTDQFPSDPNKAIADSVVTANRRVATLNINHNQVVILDVEVEKVIETFNDSTIHTTLTTTYLSESGTEYGYQQSIDHQDGSDFTRIETFHFDFNLDGNAQFEGKLLDVGTRSETGEAFWRYVDESDASVEGGTNGNSRSFEDTDFSSRTAPILTNIDTIQHHSVTISQNSDEVTYNTVMNQYVVSGFDINDQSTHVKDYASASISKANDLIQVAIRDEQDWDGNGSVNTIVELTSSGDGSYIFNHNRPIWANPQDGINEEYADFNPHAGKSDELTAYWYETSTQQASNGTITQSGQRFVLDQTLTTDGKEANIKHNGNLMFHEWSATYKQIIEGEKTEYVSWTHYPLVGYSFTADNQDSGQAYRIYQKQNIGTNDIWVAYSFDEWGSQDVSDLDLQIEAARSGGSAISEIDANLVPGLNRYAAVLPNSSFQYDESGNPIQWYAITQDSRLTDGTPTMVEMTLTPDGVLANSFVVFNSVDAILIASNESDPWPWFDAYYRQNINTYHLDLDETRFSWTTDLGQLFVSQTAAQARLEEILNPAYRLCTEANSGEVSNPGFGYQDYVNNATSCGYLSIDSSYIAGKTLYYQEDESNYFSYQFYDDGSGQGLYTESNGFTAVFSWWQTSEGIIAINNGGDEEYFAYIADENGHYSLLALFLWDEDSTPFGEIIGMEMTTTPPTVGAPYRVCTEQNRITSGIGTAEDYSQFSNAADSCGYTAIDANKIGNVTLYFEEDDLNDNYFSYHFNDDGATGSYYESADHFTRSFTWLINSDGIIEINNDGDSEYLAYIAEEADKYSMLGFFQWMEDTTPYSEIFGMEFTLSMPEHYALRSCAIDPNIASSTSATESDFSQAITDCGGEADLTGANYGNDLASHNYVRINSDGEVRGYIFSALNPTDTSGSFEKLKNGLNLGADSRVWSFSNNHLILDDNSETMTLAHLKFLDAPVEGTDQSSFVVYEQVSSPDESTVWSFVFREYDQSRPFTACEQGDSPWDQVNDQPSTFATNNDFEEAVEQCQYTTDGQVLKFTEAMISGTQWTLDEDETYSFNADHSGLWAEDSDTASFTWEINNEGYLVLQDDSGQATDTLVLTASNGLLYSVKGYWRPTDYGAVGWNNPAPNEAGLGEIWSGILSRDF